MFAAVIVLMSAIFGSAFKDILTVQGAYNHNIFYVYTKDASVSQKLLSAVGDSESGIDYLRLDYSTPQGDRDIKFMLGFFETFSTEYYDESFRTNAVYTDISLAKDLPLVAGKKTDLANEEIVITTAVADALLEKSSLGYIKEYKDLLGLISNSSNIDGKSLRIAGVVKSSETSVYLTELAMAKQVLQNSGLYVATDKEVGMETEAGKAILFIRYNMFEGPEYPVEGEKVSINGKTFVVSEVLKNYSDYNSWLEAKNIKKQSEEEFFTEMVKKENPEAVKGTHEFQTLFDKCVNNYYGLWLEYFYSELDSFISDIRFFTPDNMEAWLAV
jgi:hypothetical protein